MKLRGPPLVVPNPPACPEEGCNSFLMGTVVLLGSSDLRSV